MTQTSMDDSQYIIRPAIRMVRLRTAVLLALCASLVGGVVGWREASYRPYVDEWCHAELASCVNRHSSDTMKIFQMTNERDNCEWSKQRNKTVGERLDEVKEACLERARTRRP